MSTRSAIAWSLAVGHTLGTQGAKVSGRRSARRLEELRAPHSGMMELLKLPDLLVGRIIS